MTENRVNNSNENIVSKEEVFGGSKIPLQLNLKEEKGNEIVPKSEESQIDNAKVEIFKDANCIPQVVPEIDLIPACKVNIAINDIPKKNYNARKRKSHRKRYYLKYKCRKINPHSVEDPECSGNEKHTITEISTCMGETSTTRKDNIFYYNSSSEEGIEEYILTVSNLPKSWSFIQIKNYIDTTCGPVDEMEMLKSDTQYGSIRLFFQSCDDCNEAMTKLTDKEIEGTKLTMEMEVFKDSGPFENDESSTNNKYSAPDIDVWEDPQGLYGLKPQFLNSLDITPPIDKWVHVSNFRCDKSELRDVMELAGQVLMCTVITITNKYAKVMYSHPLEAVQAVSMLNGQTFYGKSLKVVMYRCPSDTTILPKGLANIGLGLGKRGKPLRNVVKHFKRYVNKQSSQINPLMFSEVTDLEKINPKNSAATPTNKQEDSTEASRETEAQVDSVSFRVKNVEELNSESNNAEKHDSDSSSSTPTDKKITKQLNTAHSSNESKPNQILSNQVVLSANNQSQNASSNLGQSNLASSDANVSRTLNPVRATGSSINIGFVNGSINSGPYYSAQNSVTRTPSAPFGLHFNTGIVGPRPPIALGPMGPRPPIGSGPFMRPGVPQPLGPATVHISNLPLSTTFKFLTEKLNQCGQVVSLQFTTPGCAVAGFAHRAHAERCFQQFNRLHVEGCVLDVRFI